MRVAEPRTPPLAVFSGGQHTGFVGFGDGLTRRFGGFTRFDAHMRAPAQDLTHAVYTRDAHQEFCGPLQNEIVNLHVSFSALLFRPLSLLRNLAPSVGRLL
jgi:hypothetical protein